MKLAAFLLGLTAMGAGCRGSLEDATPIPAPGELADRLRPASTPETSQLIEFRWRYRGREGRYSGEGAVRVNPPDSVRLDLLGPGWSGVQSAVLLGGAVHYIGEQRIVLPPPTFLWAMLGIFRPPAGVPPEGFRDDGRSWLTYRLPAGERVIFEFDAVGRLVEAERRRHDRPIQRIRIRSRSRLEVGGWDAPKEARFRDLAEFHEVQVELTEVRRHAPFERRIFSVVSR